jgi:membrane protease subunit HflK
VLILGVSLTDVRPPSEVAADFAEAQSAESRREDRINVARTYEAVQTATASSRGGALRQAAGAEADRQLLDARSDADRFLALLAEARRSRELTVRRLYVDAVQSLLAGVRRKLVLPPGDSIDLTILGRRDRLPSPADPDREASAPRPAESTDGER